MSMRSQEQEREERAENTTLKKNKPWRETGNTYSNKPLSMTGDAVQRTIGTLLSSLLPILFVLLYHLFHEANVVKFGKITVFEEVRPFMLRHGLDQMFDDFVRDERVLKIKLGDIRLW